MFNMTINVVKTNGNVTIKIILPVLLWLFISTMTFPLVMILPDSFVIITVPLMLIALISFIPVTIYLIKRGLKISNQHTIQKNVSFSVKSGNIFMDNQIVKIFKNPLGKRVDIKCYDTTDVFFIEMDKAKAFLQFLKDNNAL